ncbi:MAG: hypothetical protein ACO1NQ_00485, partial [Flavobacteriales bacterium]
DAGAHFFAVIVPNEGSDMNSLKARISGFNRQYFPNPPVEITNSFLDTDHQVVLLSGFTTKEMAMQYHELFSSGNEQLVGINDQGFPAFPITSANYAQLYKSKDLNGYQAFFEQNYLDGQ